MFHFNPCDLHVEPEERLKRTIEKLDVNFDFENTWKGLNEDEKLELAIMLTRYEMILQAASLEDFMKKPLENTLSSKREGVKKSKMNEKDRELYEALKYYEHTDIFGKGRFTPLEAIERSFQKRHDLDVHKYFDVEVIDTNKTEYGEDVRYHAKIKISHTEFGEVTTEAENIVLTENKESE